MSQFNEEIKKLHVTIEEYSKTEQHLKQVTKELEDTAAHLKKSVGEQSELFLGVLNANRRNFRAIINHPKIL